MSLVNDPYLALRNREFRFFLSAKFLLTVALQMQAVVASWLIYNITKDPLSLGLIGLAEAVPALSLALPGGFLADRFSRKRIIMLSTILMMIASIILCIVSFKPDVSSLFAVYGVIFLIGVARGFYTPAQSSFWAQILSKDTYVNGSVWNSTLWQIGAITGPAIGGLCYAWIGPGYSSVIICFLILLTLICYSLIAHKAIPEFRQSETMREALRVGIKFFFKQEIMLSAITLDLFAVLFGGAVALLPAFADQVLHTGPEGLGFLRSAPAIGAVIMAIFMAYRPPSKNAGNKMLLCVAGFGCCMIGFALSKNYALSFSLLLLSGMFDNVSVVIRSTILQTFTPDEMRGRVSAVNSIFVGSSNELGAFESGVAAKLMGLTNSVVFGGIMTLIVTASTYKLAPNLRKLDL
jgi:MFS family permease